MHSCFSASSGATWQSKLLSISFIYGILLFLPESSIATQYVSVRCLVALLPVPGPQLNEFPIIAFKIPESKDNPNTQMYLHFFPNSVCLEKSAPFFLIFG